MEIKKKKRKEMRRRRRTNKRWLKCIIDVSYGVALLFGVRGGGWPGWILTGGQN